jgi:hypothetical protein
MMLIYSVDCGLFILFFFLIAYCGFFMQSAEAEFQKASEIICTAFEVKKNKLVLNFYSRIFDKLRKNVW